MKTNIISTTRRNLLSGLALTTLLAAGSIIHAQTPPPASMRSIQVTSAGRTLDGFLYRPAGNGPFPAVVVMHGSGGFWSNDNPSNGMLTHLREWGELLQNNGYIGVFIDSYRARGIMADFKKKRPCFDANWDDATCSPAYERTKDAYAALAWLRNSANNSEAISNKIGLLGFSQGAETALASVVSSTVSRTWKVSSATAWTYDANGSIVYENGAPKPASTSMVAVPSPYKPVTDANGFASVVAFYPGCGFYSYFGSTSLTTTTTNGVTTYNSAVADCYMPYAPTLVLHGTNDDLWTSSQPVLLWNKSAAEAATLNRTNPITMVQYVDANHSFDMVTMAPQSAWNTTAESADQFAKRVGRNDAIAHFNATLH
jgi:dienelactone hydrolase